MSKLLFLAVASLTCLPCSQSHAFSDPAITLAGTYAVDGDDDLDPSVWLAESRLAPVQYVYTPEVIDAITVVERGLSDEVGTLTMSEDYLATAGRVAQLRAVQAGYRLGEILREGVR